MTAPTPNDSGARFLGRYELMYLLGQGGMGEVHLARLSGAAGFEKLCIVKTILPQMMSDPQFVDRFHHEAKVLVQLNHSNIAQVYDMGNVDRTLYMAIEYVAGVDLGRVQDRSRASSAMVPIPVALHIGQQICEALGYAHRKLNADGTPLGIVHRDVSPQNVMVSYEGEVKVIDFGLAKSSARSKHTMPSTVLGKLGYMSPEQARGDRVDYRSDIYSAGIVVWEMLAGRPLINGKTMGEMVAMMTNPRVPPLREVRPEVSETVERFVMRALELDPANRYARADDFARAINEQLVRENLMVSAEDVGNYVRLMCPEEFAAERHLQSRLSSWRKKGSGEALMIGGPQQAAFDSPIGHTQVRTPLPASLQSPIPLPLTAAQKAVSSPSMRDSLPPHELEHLAPNTPSQLHALAPEVSEDFRVPKSKAPMVVLTLLLLAALGGGGYWWMTQGSRPSGASGSETAAAPPPVEPPVEEKEEKEEKPPEPHAAAQEPPAQEAKPPVEEKPSKPAVPMERIEVKGPVWKVMRDGDQYYVQVTTKPRLEKGDEVKLLGPELEKKKRDVYGIATVVEVERSLARILMDEDTVVPAKVFAIKQLGPRRVRPERTKATGEQQVGLALPINNEPAAAVKPTNTEVAAVDTARKDPVAEPKRPEERPAEKAETAKVEHPAKTETAPAKTEAAPTQAPAQEASDPVKSYPRDYRTLRGGVVIGRGQAKVHIFNRNDYTWHDCEVWLPIKKHYKFSEGSEIAADDSDGVSFSKFEDFTKPEDPQFEKGWALIRCKEGAGYVPFKNN